MGVVAFEGWRVYRSDLQTFKAAKSNIPIAMIEVIKRLERAAPSISLLSASVGTVNGIFAQRAENL
ncbi:hypothetical protein DTW90_28910 [Neorhizobium sp. P12A]|uniref:hypothetical protein n=1 Tax=Rhizobium/Agrobacterium group TaxID=227290 RepID=UPI0010428564|nr:MULTISPECIES: hypothetical protein [Rhizobium/Agrobacterium group]KAA0690927.1 hypothetical protein DTW90_28910 [Neorhizobium sp. P12A]